ncbi:putative membrane protein [Anoxybacillus tepidamans]|jgi:putative membrane protein|uniref:Putative membrane protein n=1 Tax=Anoxybacteroides tepidamans TaxID=265948 RepID=A0A7W8IPE1_9BACL|nr:phage holin family protein [Anoxybacillus tepidamans]MBB5324291.1 putative membrane protein [Anoxybacillus tepidamans]
MRWVASIVVNAVLLLALAGYFDSIHLSGIGAALFASLLLSLLNTFVKPIVILMTLPVTVLTFGLFLFVINAFTLLMTSWLMGEAFTIDGFGAALLASLVLSFFHLVIEAIRNNE